MSDENNTISPPPPPPPPEPRNVRGGVEDLPQINITSESKVK